jgi:hypothetical protein
LGTGLNAYTYKFQPKTASCFSAVAIAAAGWIITLTGVGFVWFILRRFTIKGALYEKEKVLSHGIFGSFPGRGFFIAACGNCRVQIDPAHQV